MNIKIILSLSSQGFSCYANAMIYLILFLERNENFEDLPNRSGSIKIMSHFLLD